MAGKTGINPTTNTDGVFVRYEITDPAVTLRVPTMRAVINGVTIENNDRNWLFDIIDGRSISFRKPRISSDVIELFGEGEEDVTMVEYIPAITDRLCVSFRQKSSSISFGNKALTAGFSRPDKIGAVFQKRSTLCAVFPKKRLIATFQCEEE